MFLRFIKGNFLGIFWSLLAIYLSLMPGEDLPQIDILNFDKLAHFAFYGLFFMSVLWGLKKSHFFTNNIAMLVSIAYTAMFGVLMEFCQGWFTARHFDWYDALANLSGVIFVAVLVLTAPIIKQRL